MNGTVEAGIAGPSMNSNGLGYASSSRTVQDHDVQMSAGGVRSVKGKEKDDLAIRIEFGGGLHLLFSSKPKHTVHIPPFVPKTDPPRPSDVRYLIQYLKSDVLSEREEMFGEGDGVRPGILVLINDADWELEGELEYELKDGDEIVFISTLHGG